MTLEVVEQVLAVAAAAEALTAADEAAGDNPLTVLDCAKAQPINKLETSARNVRRSMWEASWRPVECAASARLVSGYFICAIGARNTTLW